MNLSFPAVCLLSVAFLAAAPSAPRPSQPPDRHRNIAGWQIDDVADAEDYDPMRRAIRLRHEGPEWVVSYEFVEGAVPVEPSRNAHVTIGGCNEQYGNSERPTSPAARVAAARTRLLALFAAARQSCPDAHAAEAEVLAGFAQAFAAADAWDRERIAALAPARRAAEMAEDAASVAAASNAETTDATDSGMSASENMSAETNDAAPPQ
ncbi:MAG: hypothetical protein JO276_15340 [Sphingomonadaceae bacterium]|nr:hypothetical protein [Sphingomonadaceae bacterium]